MLLIQQNTGLSADNTKFNSLITINKSGDNTPIFFFHGVGGNVLNYHKISKKFDKDQPVYALQARGVDGLTDYANSIEEMARFYVDEMLMVNKTNRFILAGGSMGGLLAYEAARILKSLDKKVEMLVLFDTGGPNKLRTTKKTKKSFSNLLINALYSLKDLTVKFRVSVHKYLKIPLPFDIRFFLVEKHNFVCIKKYIHNSYDGDLTLFKAPIKSSGLYSDPYLGWKDVVSGNIKTIIVDADHSYFVENTQVQDLFINELSKKRT